MKKICLLVIAAICSVALFAKNDSTRVKRPCLKGLNFGIGIPMEFRDLKAAGTDVHIGVDLAYPVNERLGMGFCIGMGGGFMGEWKPEYDADNYYGSFRLSAGLVVELGERDKRPYVLAVTPCTGFGLIDMDLVLPIEVRFGRFITDNWYLTGELAYGISLAGETVWLEPAIRAGYKFKVKERRSRHKK